MADRLLSFLHALVWPPQQEDPLDTARARSMTLMCFSAVTLALVLHVFILPLQPEHQQANAQKTVFMGYLYLAWPLAFYLTGLLRPVAASFLLYGIGVFGYLAFEEGGLLSFKAFLAVPFSAAAVFFLGWRWGLVFASVIGLGTIAMFISVGVDENYLPAEPLSYLLTIKLAGLLATLTLVTAMFFVFEREIERRTVDLVAAKRAAEDASAAKSDFMATLSHEIRTPMQGVLGMADVLAEGDLKEEDRQLARTIQDSGTALLTILNDILDFSKIEAGQLRLDPEPFSVRDCAEDVAALMGQRAKDKGLDLIVDVDPALPEHVVGDVGRIRQILTNLVGNAVKFTARGAVVLKVDGRPSGRTVGLTFQVIDTGIGISEDKLDKIFLGFTQAEDFTTRQFGGTGLGLTISRRLAHAMSGSLDVTSALGQGSTFAFRVCLPQPDPSGERADAKVRPRFADKTLWMQIPDGPLRQACLRLCAHWGLRVTADPTGPADIGLVSFAAAADAPRRAFPIVCLASPSETRPAAATFGDNAAVLSPPFRRRDLERAVASALGVAPPKQSAPRSHTALLRPASGHRWRVLVADDNATNRAVLHKMLDPEAFEVTFATNGREAVEAARDHQFDVMLMDVSMPEMDGLEATHAIRQHEDKKNRVNVPIFALTAHVQVSDRARFLEAGMDDVLAKPIRKTVLFDALSKWLPHQKQQHMGEVEVAGHNEPGAATRETHSPLTRPGIAPSARR